MEQSASHATLDEIEQTLGQIGDIKAARVVASPGGSIQEIHVLALPNKSPKQLVRDIESTIMARFGVAVDHKKISIAQLGKESIPAPEPSVAEQPRARIASVNEAVSGTRATVSVTLDLDGELYTGEASGAASQTSRQRLIALSTLEAVQTYAGEEGESLALEDVAVVQLGRERVAVSCVVLVTSLGEQAFSGSALVRQNEKDSIVRATLNAINRRMGLLTTQ